MFERMISLAMLLDSGPNPAFFLVIVAIFILLAAVINYFGKEAKIKRKLRALPVTPIGEFKAGEVGRITGHAETVGELLIAPLSKRPCMYYQVIVEQRKGGKNKRWVRLINEERYPPFMLKDGNHHAIVDTKWVQTYLDKDAEFSSGWLDDATDDLRQLLEKHGHKDTNWLGFNKTLRYQEGIIEENELVTVRGTGHWYTGKDQGLPDKFKRVLVMKSTEDEPVYISDHHNIVGKGPGSSPTLFRQ